MAEFCVWLTGLPGSGKTTLALLLEKALKAHGFRPVVLDGDNLRQFLFPELKFSREARQAQTERTTYLAKLLQQAGGVPIVALISPYRADRAWAREQVKGFVEVYVDCSAGVCALRDTKDLWARALRGELAQFTGVNDPYESPRFPEVRVRTDRQSPLRSSQAVLARLVEFGYLLPEDHQ